VLATGAFLVFLGVMFAPTTFSSRRRDEPAPALDDAQPAWQDSAGGVATLEQEDVECEAAETQEPERMSAAGLVEEAADDVAAEDVSIPNRVEESAADSAEAVVSISASSVTIEAESVLVEEASAEEVAGVFSAEGDESMAASAIADVAVEDNVEEIDESSEESSDEECDEECDESDDVLDDVLDDVAAEVAAELEPATDEVAEESTSVDIAATAVALAEPAPESAGAFENEPPVCVIETYPSNFSAMQAGDAETLDSALGAFETHEAPDVHELQYDESDLDAIDGPASEDTDSGDSIVSAETSEPPAEPEPLEERSSVPEPTDRALDSTSLFAGLDETRWIDTRSGSPRGG